MERKELINFDNLVLSERNGTYGGMAGSKEGVLKDNEYWIIKYPKNTKGMNVDNLSYTSSPLSEYIGSHIYGLLGYEVHETKLGIRNKKVVVACKDFCKKEGSLREVRTLRNTYNKKLEELLNSELNPTSSSHIIDLKEILIHLAYNPILSKIEGISERFWDCVIVDGFINNNDRNNGNWGILFENGEYKLAPIFDNGASFSDKLSDEKIRSYLGNQDKLCSSSLNTVTIFSLDDKRLTFKKMLELDEPGLKEAIKRNVPLLRNKLMDIQKFVKNIPEESFGLPVCSAERKEFYIKSMELRLERLLEPVYIKILEEEREKSCLNDFIKDASERVQNSYKQSHSNSKEISR